MIADDMMTFIKNDIIVFGLGVFLIYCSNTLVCIQKYCMGFYSITKLFFFSFDNDWFFRFSRLEGYSHIL